MHGSQSAAQSRPAGPRWRSAGAAGPRARSPTRCTKPASIAIDSPTVRWDAGGTSHVQLHGQPPHVYTAVHGRISPSPPPPAAHPACPSPDLRLPPSVHPLEPRQPAQRTALTRDSACKVPRVPSGMMAACTVAGESQGVVARAGAARARQLLPPPAANPSLHGAVGPRGVSGHQHMLHKRAGWA